MYKILKMISVSMLMVLMVSDYRQAEQNIVPDIEVFEHETYYIEEYQPVDIMIIPTIQPLTKMVLTEEKVVIKEYNEEEVELLALVMMGEAEGEGEYGQRLVIDTVLNRVDSNHFPDTIRDVIYQKNQFSAMWGGRLSRTFVTDDARRLVREELDNRTNYDVMFFTAGGYGRYGEHLFKVENHYFCSYE